MLEIPDLVAAERPPLLTLTSHRLGGTGKSLSGQIVVDAAYRSGLNLAIFENDDQNFYDPYGNVHHVVLPATDEVVHDPIADVRVHGEFDRALLEAGPDDCLIYDCAAASINRHTYVIDQLDVDPRLEAMGPTHWFWCPHPRVKTSRARHWKPMRSGAIFCPLRIELFP